MTVLDDKYYEGIVVSDEVDPNHAGAVKTRIVGVTDEIPDELLPWSIPAVVNFSAVPTKGSILEIVFDEGDVNKPKYFNATAEKNYLPDLYNSGYPNIAVANLGGDLFMMYHDRQNRGTQITHPSNSDIQWNAFGTIQHNSDNGYENAGGFKQRKGTKNLPVLTEGTIDPFTCTPVGHGVIGNTVVRQGSEYLQVTHVSKAKVDEINGIAQLPETTEANSLEESGIDEPITKPLLDSNGDQVGQATFFLSPSAIELGNDRKPTHVAIASSGNNDFVKTSKLFLNKNNQACAHYLIGTANTPPSSDSQGTDADPSTGFSQFVELKNDSTTGNNKLSPINPFNKANKNAITIMLIGTSPAEANRTSFQNEMVELIINHVKQNFSLKSSDIVVKELGGLI